MVCVVDCANLARYLTSDDIAHSVRRQIGYADRVLVNKTDMVTEEEVVAVEAAIRSINSIATQKRSVYASTAMDFVLDVAVYASSTSSTSSSSSYCVPCDSAASKDPLQMQLLLASTPVGDVQTGDGPSAAHVLPSSLRTLGFRVRGELDLQLLQRFLDQLLYPGGYDDDGGGRNHEAATSTTTTMTEGESGERDRQSGRREIYRMKGIVHIAGHEVALLS